MPDYAIKPEQHPEEECALCGANDDIVEMHVRNAGRGGTKVIPGCRSCNASMRSQTFKAWLRSLRDEDHWKWYEILEFQKWKRTSLSLLVRQIRDE